MKAVTLAITMIPFALWQIYLWHQIGQLPVFRTGGFFGFPGAGVFRYLRSLPIGTVDKTLVLAWSNLAMVFLALWSIVTGITKFLRKRSVEPMILLLWGLMPLFAKLPLWEQSITGLGRLVAPMYLFMVLSCRHRVNMNSKAIITCSVALGVAISLALLAFPVPIFHTTE